jgi:hypothetical protein
MHNFIGNRIGFDFFSIGSSALGIGSDKINKNSIRSDKKDKIPIGSDFRVQKPILATANFFKVEFLFFDFEGIYLQVCSKVAYTID